MIDDLLDAFEAVQDRAEEAELVAQLAREYVRDDATRGLIVALASHLGERVKCVARGVAGSVAKGRLADERARAAVLAAMRAR